MLHLKSSHSLESDLPRPGKGDEVSMPGLPDSVKGIDTTNPTAGMANYKLDMSRSEFEDELFHVERCLPDQVCKRPFRFLLTRQFDTAMWEFMDTLRKIG